MAQVGCERDAILAGADVVVAEAACRAERRVLEFYSFVTRDVWMQILWLQTS